MRWTIYVCVPQDFWLGWSSVSVAVETAGFQSSFAKLSEHARAAGEAIHCDSALRQEPLFAGLPGETNGQVVFAYKYDNNGTTVYVSEADLSSLIVPFMGSAEVETTEGENGKIQVRVIRALPAT